MHGVYILLDYARCIQRQKEKVSILSLDLNRAFGCFQNKIRIFPLKCGAEFPTLRIVSSFVGLLVAFSLVTSILQYYFPSGDSQNISDNFKSWSWDICLLAMLYSSITMPYTNSFSLAKRSPNRSYGWARCFWSSTEMLLQTLHFSGLLTFDVVQCRYSQNGNY